MVDRLLSNSGIDVWGLFEYFVPEQIGKLKDIKVIIDWTDFDDDDQATIALNLVGTHGYLMNPLIFFWILSDQTSTVLSKIIGWGLNHHGNNGPHIGMVWRYLHVLEQRI